jgi:hypothetical protein
MRTRFVAPLAALMLLAAPVQAFGAEADGSFALKTGTGVAALLTGIVLLVVVMGLRRVAAGAAFTENITYVVLAAICLVASVLAGWVARFVPSGVTATETSMAADLLIVMSMILFIVYFNRLRAALLRFLKEASAAEALVQAHASADTGAEGRGGEDGVG